MILCILCVLSILGIFYLFRTQASTRRVTLVVLGDIGRSPRMQYHALSFAKEGFDVDFVGYGGSLTHKNVSSNRKIHIYHIREPPEEIQKLPRLMIYVIKVIWQSFMLFFTLMLVKKPKYLLVQNPPAIPSLAICWLVSCIRNVKFIIDWHNYGYTILQMALEECHPFVRFAKWYEQFFGRLSYANICVSRAMCEDLKANWDIEAVVMYDRPASLFKRTDLLTQHKLFCKLAKDYDVFRNEVDCTKGATTFTLPLPDGSTVQYAKRPALLMSSTSWTKDEDFSVLLDALEKYDQDKVESNSDLPDIVCVITGKGPQKSYYKSVIANKCWRHVRFCTPWLDAEDYPRLMGSADIGVCLHKSSSGLDLPMKVVDMFGCGLPVCAVHFNCLDELVKHEHNGLVFKTPSELTAHLQDLLKGFPDDCKKLDSFRQNIKGFQVVRWDNIWKQTVLPLLD